MNQLLLQKNQNSFLEQASQWLKQSLFQENSLSAYMEPIIQAFIPGWTTEGIRSEIDHVRQESENIYSLIIRPGKGWKQYTAGQYVQITAEQNGVLQTRTFSLSTAPDYYKSTGLIELSIREQEGGKVTPWLKKHYDQGGYAVLSQASGDFTLPEGNSPVLMIAGGSGITPFRSMLNQLASQQSQRNVQLLYYVRNLEHGVFRDELEAIAQNSAHLEVTLVDSEKEGFISAEHLKAYCPDFLERTSMICGPTPMIQEARRLLQEQGVQEDSIKYEYFGAAPIEMESAEAEVFVSFSKSNISTLTNTEKPSTLLDIAEQQGLKPLSGCRAGVCMQCRCTKNSGVVYNSLTGKYSDTGKQEIQPCISVAVSDVELDI